jgi:hypothetical protein
MHNSLCTLYIDKVNAVMTMLYQVMTAGINDSHKRDGNKGRDGRTAHDSPAPQLFRKCKLSEHLNTPPTYESLQQLENKGIEGGAVMG